MLTPSREELIADIRRACIEANPGKCWFVQTGTSGHDPKQTLINKNPCHLADILLAIGEKKNLEECRIHMSVWGRFSEDLEFLAQWNLRLPFEKQSKKVLLFIHGLVK